MKTIASTPLGSGLNRTVKILVAALGLATASAAFAGPLGEVSVSLAQKVFVAGASIEADSGTKAVFASKAYKYQISATCTAEPKTPLAKIVKDGTSLAAFLESISPGASSFLKGSFSNPSGTLPATLVNKPIKGSKTVTGIGVVKVSFGLVVKVLENGQCAVEINNIKLSSTPKKKLGSLKFKNGSKLTISASSVVAILNNTKNISESNSSVVVQVTRLQNFKGAISVNYATSNGTADTVNDYVATNGTLNFADGEKSKNITVNLINNNVKDGLRTFNIQLSNPSAGTFIGTYPSMVVTIVDND
ncbi:MAG: Calx-beta domain-containing protein [Luteolibacter sp.]